MFIGGGMERGRRVEREKKKLGIKDRSMGAKF